MVAAAYAANTALGCLGGTSVAVSMIGGLSLIPWAFMMSASLAFGFCPWHRVPLYYCAAEDALNLADMTWTLPLDDLSFLCAHAALTAAFASATAWLYARDRRRGGGRRYGRPAHDDGNCRAGAAGTIPPRDEVGHKQHST